MAYGLWGLFPLYFHHLAPATAIEILVHRVVWSFVVVAAVQRYRRQPSGFALLRADPARAARIALAALLLTTNWLVYRRRASPGSCWSGRRCSCLRSTP